MAEGQSKPGAPPKERPPYWVVTTYFAEGFPYSLVRQISTVYFKDHGASLEAVGLTSLYGLPWVLKFLWAPLLDAVWTKRRWLLLAEAALALGAVGMAAASASPAALAVGGWVFLLCAFLSATHDIGVDGYYLEALDRRRQALFVGFQAMAFRLSLIAGGGGVVWFSGITGWPAAFLLAAGVLAALCAFHAASLPAVERPKAPLSQLLRRLAEPRAAAVAAAGLAVLALAAWGALQAPRLKEVPGVGAVLGKVGVGGLVGLALVVALVALALLLPWLKRRLAASEAFYAKAFVDWLDQPRIGVILAFLLLYRTGESALLAMVYPLLSDIGLTRADYGIAYGTLGITASILGGLTGGALIARYGFRRAIWPLVLAQNVPNLLYAGLALAYCGGGRGAVGLALVAPLVMVEAFGAGMGTSAFMVFLQRTCKADFRAAHYAIASSVMNVSATFGGALSGFLADAVGFPLFFTLTFAATVPSMALIFFLPHLDAPGKK